MHVEQQEQQKHPQELEVVKVVMVEEWVQKMVESYKGQAWIPLSSTDRENLEIFDRPDQIVNASAFVAVPRLS